MSIYITRGNGNGSKANEYAKDALIQLVTIASGTLVLSLTFVKDIVGDSGGVIFFLIPCGWAFLSYSIWIGWVAIAQASRQIDENGDDQFAFGSGKAKSYAIRAQWTFFVGLIMIIAFAVTNFVMHQPANKKDEKVQFEINNFYTGQGTTNQQWSTIVVDSIGSITGFAEGAVTGYNTEDVRRLIAEIENTSNIGSLLIVGEVDKRELQKDTRSIYGSNISLARSRAECVRTLLNEVCVRKNISIVTFSRGAGHVFGAIDKTKYGQDRQVIIYALVLRE
jgi:hypothetical protein